MKKLICVLMIVALMAAFMVVSAFAAENAQIIVDSASAATGEEVVLKVSLKNNPGITNGKIEITYDETAFELVGFDFENECTWRGLIDGNIENGQVAFVTTADTTKDHVLCEVVLKVKDEAAGQYEIGVNVLMMKNNAEEDVTFETVAGIVTVTHVCDLEDVAEVPADCTENGVRAHQKCSACGKLYIDGVEVTEEDVVIPALGHIPAEPVKENVVAATCTTGGSYDEVVYCSVCGEELSRETVEVPGGHTPAEPVKENEVAATCTTDGSYEEVVYCSVCGEELSREKIVVPAAHTPAEPVIENVVEATCTTDGSYEEVVYCTECGEELSRVKVVVPAAHNYVDGVCTECGEKDPNPETGDFVYVAVATALVSMMGIVALTKKKEF